MERATAARNLKTLIRHYSGREADVVTHNDWMGDRRVISVKVVVVPGALTDTYFASERTWEDAFRCVEQQIDEQFLYGYGEASDRSYEPENECAESL